MIQSVTRALLVLLLAPYIKCERRIVNGEEVDKSYAVYIVWDLSDEKQTEFRDITTICGGFLINEYVVVTAAHCLKMCPIQYVIAGYNKYVPGGIGRNQEEKDCLEIAKIPIIEKCYRYFTEIRLNHGWQYVDFGMARLAKSYDFNDVAFTEKCSYQPTPANYKYRDLMPGTDVVVYGWGSSHYHKPENISLDINEEYLRATTTKVIALDECNSIYNHTISNGGDSRFCTEGESSLDVNGEPIGRFRRSKTNNGTKRNQVYALDLPGVPGNKTIVLKKILRTTSRRHGPCQNDHGGPIATWEDGEEIVFGIITGYLVNKDMECVSPYIYTVLSYYKDFITCNLEKFKAYEK